MARSSRLSVCLAMVMRNSSKIHCARSTSRQRTTPWTAEIGPFSIISPMAWRWASLSLEGWPSRTALDVNSRTLSLPGLRALRILAREHRELLDFHYLIADRQQGLVFTGLPFLDFVERLPAGDDDALGSF